MKETIVCKFDGDLKCDSYICEEDASTLEMLLDSGKRCPMFELYEKLLSEKILREKKTGEKQA